MKNDNYYTEQEEELAEQALIEELKCINYFSLNLQIFRHENNLTQKDLAHKLCISESTYANWEQGRREPNIYFIIKLVKILNIDYNALFNFEEAKKMYDNYKKEF